MKKSGGVYVKLNGNQAVQKVAGSKGAGTTKSVKINEAQKKAGGRVGGGNKPASVEPKSKKKNVK
jgi:hypothetical protein